MKLSDWRKAKKLTQAQVGEGIGVHRISVVRYEEGRVPEPAVMERIIAFTNGDVTANDFFDIPGQAEPEQAVGA